MLLHPTVKLSYFQESIQALVCQKTYHIMKSSSESPTGLSLLRHHDGRLSGASMSGAVSLHLSCNGIRFR
jgi:hypothetical protein